MRPKAPFGLQHWRAFRRPFGRPQSHQDARRYYHVASKRFRKRLDELDLSASDQRWSTSHDMYPSHRALYGLDANDASEYLTDAEQAIAGVINGPATPLLRNKVVMHQMLSPLVDMPRIVGLYVNGKRDPHFDEAPSGRLFVKPVDKYRGIGVSAVEARDLSSVVDATLKDHASIFISETVDQHEMLRALSPFSVNTIRIVTVRDPATRVPMPIAAVIRLGTEASAPVDNFGAGGASFDLDMTTGRIGDGVQKAHPSERLRVHPDTGAVVAGVELPFASAVVAKCIWLHSKLPLMDIVGWDMTIRPDGGMLLIEANPTTDVDLLQAHRPLLRDPRTRAFFEHHGVI